MPQHPASRSVTCAPGIRRSSAAAAAGQPHRSLVAVRMQQHRSRPRPERAARRGRRPAPPRGTLRTAHWRGPRSRRAREPARAAAPADPLAPPTGSSARQRRWPRRAAAASCRASTVAPPTALASSSRPCEISGRAQQPCGTTRAPMPACSQDVERRLADVRIDVLGEGVGEEHRPWRRRPAAAPRLVATACGGSTPAASGGGRCPRSARPARGPAGCRPSGWTAAPAGCPSGPADAHGRRPSP